MKPIKNEYEPTLEESLDNLKESILKFKIPLKSLLEGVKNLYKKGILRINTENTDEGGSL